MTFDEALRLTSMTVKYVPGKGRVYTLWAEGKVISSSTSQAACRKWRKRWAKRRAGCHAMGQHEPFLMYTQSTLYEDE